MTQERLRELLRERVADETMADHSQRAWQAARGVRRRHRIGAVAGVVAATLGVSAGVAAVDSTAPTPPSDRGVADVSRSPDAAADTTPDAAYEGVPVWWSPDQFEEQHLASVDSPLPADIDLDDRPDDPMDRALAAFAHGESVTLIGPDGARRWVDLSGIQDMTKPNGYSYFPASTGMLTSAGRWLVFPQPGDTVAIYGIASGRWSTAEIFADDADAALLDLGFALGSVQRYGENRDGAQSFGMGLPIPVRDHGTEYSDPEFLGTRGSVLVFTWKVNDGQGSRYKQCCPVAGWLDDDTVVYESRQDDPLLVSWRVGTHDFGLVSRIHGAYDVASFALTGS